jgi:hypothetical protein
LNSNTHTHTHTHTHMYKHWGLMSAIIVPALCIYLIDMITEQAASSKFGHERGVQSKITVLVFNFITLYYSFSLTKNI